MRPRLLLTINWKFAVDFFARGLHTRTAVARLPLRQLGFLVTYIIPRLHSYCLSLSLCLEWYNGSITPRLTSTRPLQTDMKNPLFRPCAGQENTGLEFGGHLCRAGKCRSYTKYTNTILCSFGAMGICQTLYRMCGSRDSPGERLFSVLFAIVQMMMQLYNLTVK